MAEGGLAGHPKKGLRLGLTFGFHDETGFSDRPIVAATWAKRGHTPMIRSAGGWKSRAVLGTLLVRADGTRPRLVFSLSSKAVGAVEVLDYLQTLKRYQRGRPFLLLWDGLPGHRAKIIRCFIAQNRSWLTVKRFPPYAPELNPAEYVWSSSKRKDLAHVCPKTMNELERRVKKSLRRIGRDPSVLKGCLRASSLYC